MTQAEQTPWHTPSWFTSPWNHEPSVAGRLAFPPNIEFLDRASIGASEDQRLDILQRVKVLSLAHKRLLTGDEFESIALSVTGDLPGPSGGDG